MTSVELLKSHIHRLLDSDQPCSALPLTQIVCELEPDSPEVQLLKAKTLFQLREFDSVLRCTKQLLDINALNAAALLLSMKSTFELGDLKQCLQYAESLLEIPDNCVSGLCYIAKCSELSGDTGKAVKNYVLALKNDPFCGEAVDALVERRLLDAKELLTVIDNLHLPPAAEVLRSSYKAKIKWEDQQLIVKGVPKSLILLQEARREYERNNVNQALSLVTELLDEDPYNREAVCLQLSVLVAMKATPKLFEVAHFLSRSKPRAELAVYAIGCFYYALSNYEKAGRYFSRATELDYYFAEAWIAYGHCYAKLEEGEQALNVYRRAMSCFPGLSCCCVYVGMQYSRIHQWPIALCFFEESLKKTPLDSTVLNEIGVLYIRTQRLAEAVHFFRQAYDNLPNSDNPSEFSDCVVFNLATALRKAKDYPEAIKLYSQYIRCRPNAGHGHCALGFTYHLSGHLKAAIAHYHTALSIKPDSFCRDMLDRALATDFGQNVGDVAWGSETAYASPSPGDVSFSTISKTLRSESTTADSAGLSPRQSVGRSLMF